MVWIQDLFFYSLLFFFFSFWQLDTLITPVLFISVFFFQALICNLLMSSINVHLKVGLFTRPSILFMGLFLHNTLRELSICSQIFFLSNSIFAILPEHPTLTEILETTSRVLHTASFCYCIWFHQHYRLTQRDWILTALNFNLWPSYIHNLSTHMFHVFFSYNYC